MNPDDIVIWPDAYWCFASELSEHNHRSDDYQIVRVNTAKWQELTHFEDIDFSMNTGATTPCLF